MGLTGGLAGGLVGLVLVLVVCRLVDYESVFYVNESVGGVGDRLFVCDDDGGDTFAVEFFEDVHYFDCCFRV